jgi:hypothetical protein
MQGDAHDALQRRELEGNQTLVVYRLVQGDDPNDPSFREALLSNLARKRPPKGREKRVPEIHEGLSVYKTVQQAQEQRQRIGAYVDSKGLGPVRIGDFAAEIRLEGGAGFQIEDRGEVDGHMTIWGDPDSLLARVADIVRVVT